MGLQNRENPASGRLTTWKEIAAFLGRDESTVKRWEGARGLPVRRVPGQGRASVFAYQHELQAWLDSSGAGVAASAEAEIPDTLRETGVFQKPRRLWVASCAIAAAFGLALAVFWFRAPVVPAQATKPHDPLAMEYYKSGLHEWQTRTPSGLARAVNDFNSAIRRDPSYAEAYVGLANTYNLLREFTLMPPNEAYAKARSASMHAIALDPSLAGAHAALAFTDFYWLRDVPGADAEFKRAIALDSGSANTHHWYATFLMTIGDFRSARDQIEKAAELDTESAAILADKALILFYERDAQRANDLLMQIERDQPLFASPHYYLSVIDLTRGNDLGYLQEMKLYADSMHDANGAMLASAGQKGLTLQGHEGMLQSLLAAQLPLYASNKLSAYAVAQTYALLGDKQNALAYLRISLSRQEPEIMGLKINPLLASLRTEPNFAKLLVSVGLRGRA